MLKKFFLACGALTAQVLEVYLARLGLVLYFGGGDSSSSSTTSTSTTSVDKRQVVSDAGVGVSSDQSTVNVTQLDQGAVQGALTFAGQGYDALLKLTQSTFDKAFAVVDKSNALAKDLSASVGTAYDVAQSSVSGARDQQKTLLIVGAVVLGIFAFKKG